MFRIDQTGLSTGTLNVSRTDGLPTGAEVTITYVGRGTFRPRLLWVPTGDTGSESTLAESTPGVWTFTPTANTYGTYRIEGIENEGKSSERRVRRLLRVRTPSGLIIPAFGERANSLATLVNSSASLIEESEDNAVDYSVAGLNDRAFAGTQRALEEAILAADRAWRMAPALMLTLRKVGTAVTILGFKPNTPTMVQADITATGSATNHIYLQWTLGKLRAGVLAPIVSRVQTSDGGADSPDSYQETDATYQYVVIRGYSSGGGTVANYSVRINIDGEGTFTD